MRSFLVVLLLFALALPALAALSPGDPAPDFSLTDQEGRTLTMADLKGRVVILSFFYRTCPEATMCPRLMARLQEAYKQASARPGGDRIRVVAVTLDPAKDTPEALKEYAAAQGLKSPQWRLLTGEEAKIQALARAYGVAFFRQKDGTIGHNMGTAVVGPDGRFRKLFPGSAWDPGQVAAEASALAAK